MRKPTERGRSTHNAERNEPPQPSLIKRTEHRYILFNKPYDVVSQFTADAPGQRTLAEFHLPKGIYAAGRLDRDSEGLLLLTDDGPLIKALLDPANGHDRTYLAQVEGTPQIETLFQIERGLLLGSYRTKPANVKRLSEDPDIAPRDVPIRVRKNIPTSWLRISLMEGKNRQVRRMTAAVGLPTLRLIRIAIGPLKLDGILPGEWRELPKDEAEQLRKSVIGPR